MLQNSGNNQHSSSRALEKRFFQRHLTSYAQFGGAITRSATGLEAVDSDDEPSTSSGRRRRGRPQKSHEVRIAQMAKNNDISDSEPVENVKRRRGIDNNGAIAAPNNSWYTLEDVTRRHHDATNTDITSFRVRALPDVAAIKSLQDYQVLIYDLMADLIGQIASGTAADDMVKIMLMSQSLESPIIAAPVPFSQLLQTSNKIFIHDEDFTFYAAVTHRPRGLGRKAHKVFTAAQAVQKLQSIVHVKTPDGLCLPACLLLAQVGSDDRQYGQWKNTGRPQLRRAAAAYARATLGREILPDQGCTLDDLDVFQDMLGDEYQIKVYRWGPPTRKCIYIGRCRTDTPKLIFLMYENAHFDLIKSLPAFFQQNFYCHHCDKGISDERRHMCLVKCGGCFRPNCPDRDTGLNIFCPDCNHFFPGHRCFVQHTTAQPGGRTFCSRVKYCFTCNKLRCEWGIRENKHVCKGIFCRNCDSFCDLDHKCYMRRFKGKATQSTATTTEDSDSALSDAGSNDDNGDIAENRAREVELDDGVVAGPDAQDEVAFRSHKICYFDSEAFVCDTEGIHTPNLIIAQKSDDYEMIFDGSDATDRFCNWAISHAHKDYTFVSHYGRKYDNYFPQKWILENGHSKPFTIMRNCSVMLLYVKKYNIRFIDSSCFLAAPLAKLPSMFGLENEIKKGNFPHRFNKPKNFDYVGAMPPVQTYDPDRMSAESRAKFLVWYDDQIQNNHVFDFQLELNSYCRDDVKVLRICCEKFRSVFYLQSTVDPFSCLTIASACNKVFRKLFLPRNTIAIISPNGYAGNDIQSHAALEWLDWMSYSTGLQIRHRNNGGEVKTVSHNGRILKLDGACQDGGRKLAFEFYGWWFHGCPKCYTATTHNPLLKQSMKELYESTVSREALLKHDGWHVEAIWHCQYTASKKNNPALQQFVARFGVPEPLNPRDAFMGGRVNATQLYCEAPLGTAIRYYDINSLYPYCNKYKSYPIGHPTILRGPEIDINKVREYYGLMKSRILAPRNLFHPVLGYRCNNKLLFPLCRVCAEDKYPGPCGHTQEERAMSGTWTTIEIVKALNLGYTILDCYEIWHFPEQSDTIHYIQGHDEYVLEE